MKIDQQVLQVLSNATVEGNMLFLNGQLDRNLYTRTNKVLEAAGGKWNRKAKAHIFEQAASDRVEQMLLTGDIVIPQDFGYFPTPIDVVERLIDAADLGPDMLVLEPSAGQGAIANQVARIAQVDCIELLPDNAAKIKVHGNVRSLLQSDFLTQAPQPQYDRVIMNPPFEKQADIKHVLHAHQFLKPGGRLVSVMAASVLFRSNRLTTEFREFVESKGGWLQELPEGSFKASGTMVNTVIVTIPN